MPKIHAVARIVSSPTSPSAVLLEGVLQAAEKKGHQYDARVVGAAQQGQVWSVYMHEHRHCDCDECSRQKVDKEQPVPGVIFGYPPADGRPQGRCSEEIVPMTAAAMTRRFPVK